MLHLVLVGISTRCLIGTANEIRCRIWKLGASTELLNVRIKTSGAGWGGISEMVGSATDVSFMSNALSKTPSKAADYVMFVGGIRFTPTRTLLGPVPSAAIV